MEEKQFNIKNGLQKFFESKKKFQNIKISDLHDITAGWETINHAFILQYTENKIEKQKKLVVKIFPRGNAEKELKDQLFIYNELSKQNYPTPKIHYNSTDIQFIGKPFLIMDWLIGGVLDKKTETDLDETMKVMCRLLVDLHRLDWKPFLNTTPLSYTIDFQLDIIDRRITNYKLDELKPLMKWLRNERNRIKEEFLVFCHFDFHTRNILLDEKGNHFVIDWSDAHVGDFRFDLGKTMLIYRVYINQKTRNFIFQNYLELSGKEINNIDFFEVASIADRFTILLVALKSTADKELFNEHVIQEIKDTSYHVENLNSYLEELAGFRINEIDELIKKIKEE